MNERDRDGDSASAVPDEPRETAGDGGADRGDAQQSHGHHDHDVEGETIGVAVVTVSTSRSRDDDPGGDTAAALVREAGHEVAERTLVPDDRDQVQSTVADLTETDAVAAVVTTGGTGVTPDDVTVDAVEPLFEKRLPGFGELFRRRSADEIGTRAMLSRATAGIAIAGGCTAPVFCLPGSVDAVELGVSELVVPELHHVVELAHREVPSSDGGAEGEDRAPGSEGGTQSGR